MGDHRGLVGGQGELPEGGSHGGNHRGWLIAAVSFIQR